MTLQVLHAGRRDLDRILCTQGFTCCNIPLFSFFGSFLESGVQILQLQIKLWNNSVKGSCNKTCMNQSKGFS